MLIKNMKKGDAQDAFRFLLLGTTAAAQRLFNEFHSMMQDVHESGTPPTVSPERAAHLIDFFMILHSHIDFMRAEGLGNEALYQWITENAQRLFQHSVAQEMKDIENRGKTPVS